MAHSLSDLQIKTFQIQNSADEQAVNEFLSGKIVRHWSASFSPSASLPSTDGSPIVLGVWNIFVAYEVRSEVEHDRESHDRSQDRGRQNLNSSQRKPQQRGRELASPRQANPAPAKSDKAVVEDYKPQVPDQDFPLFDAIRKWRNTRAREARVKPYSFFNNRQLEQIVTAKPDSGEGLRAIATDMSPELWDKYHTELLAFIDTARNASGGSVLQSSSEVSAEALA